MKKITPQKESPSDKIHEAIKAGLGTLPAVGSLAQYLFDQIIKPPFSKRSADWMERVSAAINENAENIEALQNNPRFITVFIQASQIAMRNHQEEKLRALQNAILNSVEIPSYDESFQIHFLNLVDRFTEWHLRILKIFSDPKWLENAKLGAFGHGRKATEEVVKKNYPVFNQDGDLLLDLILDDLQGARLIQTHWNTSGMHIMAGAASTPKLTKIGRDFLAFIRDPNRGDQKAQPPLD